MTDPSEDELRECFDAFDKDHSGTIERNEIKEVCTQLGIDATKAEIDNLMSTADADGDGKISFEEFSNAVLG